jgi:hypothetical protein
MSRLRRFTIIYLASGALWVAWAIDESVAKGSGARWLVAAFACFGLTLGLAAYLTPRRGEMVDLGLRRNRWTTI